MSGGGSEGAGRGTSGAQTPGGASGRITAGSASDGHRRRVRRVAGRVVIAVLAGLVLIGTGVEWTITSRADAGIQARSIQAVAPDDLNIAAPSSDGAPPPAYPAQNILLFGSDSRAAANGNASNTDASINTSVSQSDTLMVAHVSADHQRVTILSIPRDLQVNAPTCREWRNGVLSDTTQPVGPGEMWKITNTFAVGGPACTVRAVQQLTGLRIDRVIGIDFVGFQAMVDAVGGVQVDICRPIIDAEIGTVIPTGGEQLIHGDTALSLVRARQVASDPTGDLGRIRRQQIVLSALLRQVSTAGVLLNPASLNAFLQAFVQNTYTDNVTIDDLVALAQSFGALDPSEVTFYTLPTHTSDSNPDALALDTATATAVFQALVNDQPLPGQPAPTTSTAATAGSTDRAAANTAPPNGSSDPGTTSDLPAVNAGQPVCA